MTMTPLLLGALAFLLAGPVPALMGRVAPLRRTPFAALLLWQSVAVAAVLAALGATLALVTVHAGAAGTSGAGTSGAATLDGVAAYAVAAVALGVTGLVAGRLLLSGHRVGTSLRRLRRQHREQVDLLARADDQGVRVLEDPDPVAYCLPGVQHSRVVVSAGIYERLDGAEIDAVLAHERAHLRARHDLVVEFFDVLHRAFPRWVSSRAALAEVRLLVEMLADRAAARAAGRRPLAEALVALAAARTPQAALGAGSGRRTDLLARIEVLSDPRPRRAQALAVGAVAGAVLVLPTWLVVAPWLTGLVRM